jgi:hypothetical protein
MNIRPAKTLRIFLSICISIAIAAAYYLSYRNKQIERLYSEAAGLSYPFRGPEESQEAVKRLATYRGRRITNMLLNIALGHNVLIAEAQTEAMKALRERKDPEVATLLASRLQPFEDLATRQAVTETLQYLPCKDECIRYVLHYLERVWRGEPNYEDRTIFPTGGENWKADQQKSHQDLYGGLYLILQRNKMETLVSLGEIHGLGSEGPSLFSLDLLSRLGLHEACPYLLQSERLIQKRSPDFYNDPRQEIRATMTSLNCK